MKPKQLKAEEFWCATCSEVMTGDQVSTEIDHSVPFEDNSDWEFIHYCTTCSTAVEEGEE